MKKWDCKKVPLKSRSIGSHVDVSAFSIIWKINIKHQFENGQKFYIFPKFFYIGESYSFMWNLVSQVIDKINI